MNSRKNDKIKKKTKGKGEKKPYLFRFITIALVFVFVAGGLGWRLSVLQIDENEKWRSLADDQQLKSTPIEPSRGTIYDTNMKPMAKSDPAWTVVAAPNMLVRSTVNKETSTEEDPARVASQKLAEILELDEATLFENLSDGESQFYKIKDKIDKPTADKIREMVDTFWINGIYLQEDAKRYYPYDELAATVLGFVNTDNSGIEGLERQYDDVLTGTPGRLVTVRNAIGGEVPTGEADAYPPEDGKNLVLTIDVDIQMVLEDYLAKAVEKYSAKERGMGIVMDVNTGAILGMATMSSYNPNDPYFILNDETRAAIDAMPEGDEKSQAQLTARILQWRNKAVVDAYEPGSAFKVVTAAAALDSGMYTPGSPFYCPSNIEIADRVFNCSDNTNSGHPTAHGNIDLSKALIESCNVSFVEMGQSLGVETWYNYVNAFGLTEPTGIDLPGEPDQYAIQNLIYAKDKMGAVESASCSFGQSNKYTALQMITAVSAAVNGGNLMQPYFVRQVVDNQGNVIENIDPVVKRQVISNETSAELRVIMEELVASTQFGRNAFVAGYHVGGKSGTSQKLDLLAQDENRKEYVSSFLGFAPANDPKIAVLIVLDEPEDHEKGNYFGGRLAGPTAREVIRETMPILGIDPDFNSDEERHRSTVSTPGLVGNELSAAQFTLNEKGLQYTVVGGGASVVGQYPVAFTPIPSGGQVILYTDPSVLQETVTMPDLNGKAAKNAIDILTGMGLNVITGGAPDEAAGVVVIQQDIAPESVIPKGTVVSLVMEDTSVAGD